MIINHLIHPYYIHHWLIVVLHYVSQNQMFFFTDALFLFLRSVDLSMATLPISHAHSTFCRFSLSLSLSLTHTHTHTHSSSQTVRKAGCFGVRLTSSEKYFPCEGAKKESGHLIFVLSFLNKLFFMLIFTKMEDESSNEY